MNGQKKEEREEQDPKGLEVRLAIHGGFRSGILEKVGKEMTLERQARLHHRSLFRSHKGIDSHRRGQH